MIIIPLDRSFGSKAQNEQRQIIAELQIRAASAGLLGTVVPVWEDYAGRMNFIAPQNWHPYFRGLDMWFVGVASSAGEATHSRERPSGATFAIAAIGSTAR